MPPHRESAGATGGRTVLLEVPARPGYVVLARLALSAVCRLTPLGHDEVADLKLAITEAASTFVGGPEDAAAPLEPASSSADEATLRFEFGLDGTELTAVVACDGARQVPEEERELSRAIIAATVDRYHAEPDVVRLVKRLGVRAG